MAEAWHWSEGHIEMLDNRKSWNVHQVLKERRVLVDEITHSYMALSKFARTHSELVRIEQKDLNILGRKLYAAFERKAGKIETINRGISANMMAMVDMSKVAYRPLVGNGVNRDTSILTNVQNADEDLRKDMVLTEAGLEVTLPESHALYQVEI